MAPLDKRPPPRPGRPPALDLQPERETVRHSGVDGAVQAVPRKGTLPGGMGVIPQPDLLKTTPAPRTDAPTGRATPASGTPAQTPDVAVQDALRRRAEAAEARAAEFERRERVRAESESPNSYPPKTVERHPSPPPATRQEAPSTPPDAALGKAGRYLFSKAWPFLVAALGLGAGAGGLAKPTADPAKQEATLANTEAMRADLALLREQVAGMLKREAARDAYIRCLEDQVDDVGSQLLPAVDRQGAAAPLRAYVNRCQRLRP